MPYQDSWATCGQCGKQFIFRIEEQRRLNAQGEELAPPEQCPACRGAARGQSRQQEQRPAPGVAAPAPRPAAPPPRPRQAPRPAPKPLSAQALGYGPHEGEVKWFSVEKGYGFVVHPSGQEVFVHRSGVAPGEAEYLRDGIRVTFLIEETERGPQAVDVERLS